MAVRRMVVVALALTVFALGVVGTRWARVVTPSPPAASASVAIDDSQLLTSSADVPVMCDAKAPAADLTFVLRDLDGRDVRLSDLRGKVLLIDFWATWCMPCRVEIPLLIDLHNRFKDRGLEILGLVVQDDFTRAVPFAREWRMTYPVLDAIDRADVETAYAPILGLPTSILIGRDGRVCARHLGIAGLEQLALEIDALL